ncbi:MAG: hypothetical protein Q9222_002543 [Ikaeria aurantiellina]
MRFQSLALATLMAAAASTSPVPGSAQAITDEQMARIASLGLDKRGSASSVQARSINQPITDEQYAKIAALSVSERSTNDNGNGNGMTLEARDKRSNCAKTILGERAGGKGIWCPKSQYTNLVQTFCRSAATTDIPLGHETSDTYEITLTNQDHPEEVGKAGRVAFAIFNTKSDPTYLVTYDDCVDYMLKQSNTDSKCYGKKHDDTEGGYWSVDGVGLFGSEVREGGL